MGNKPSAPKYDTEAAIKEQNRINQAYSNQLYANVNSPTGGYSVSVDPGTGQLTVSKNLSENSLLAQQAQNNALNQFVANPNAATQAYYNSQMAYVQPQFDAQIDAAKADMANRGIKMGSKTWNETLASLENAQDKARIAMVNDAMFNGQNYQSNILNQASMLGSQIIDPTMVSGQGGAGLYDMYEQQYQNSIDEYKTKLARYNAAQQAWIQAINPLGGMSGSFMGDTGNMGFNSAVSAQKKNPYYDGAIDYGQAASASNMIS